jgi:hypothetical protein
MAKPSITQNELKQLFEYKNGNLYRLTTLGNYNVGMLAGGEKPKRSYRYIHIKGANYLAHRLIYLYHHGIMPKFIDHIDENKVNNTIENLRPATHQQNCLNIGIKKSNTSGVKGVSWHPRDKVWMAQIRIEGKKVFLGNYKDIAEAEKIVRLTRDKFHGEFINHGIANK